MYVELTVEKLREILDVLDGDANDLRVVVNADSHNIAYADKAGIGVASEDSAWVVSDDDELEELLQEKDRYGERLVYDKVLVISGS